VSQEALRILSVLFAVIGLVSAVLYALLEPMLLRRLRGRAFARGVAILEDEIDCRPPPLAAASRELRRLGSGVMGFGPPSQCRFATHPWTGRLWPFPVVVAGTIQWSGEIGRVKARLGMGPILVLLAAAILGMSVVTILATNLQRPQIAAVVGIAWIALVAAFRTCVTPSRERARDLVAEIRDFVESSAADGAPGA
jgi:hypothetical protein